MNKSDQACDSLDRLCRAQALAAQLEALLSVTTGEVGESFAILSDLFRNNFMWACGDMASELVKVLDEIEVRRGQ
ncbi:hypothetical protein PQR72_27625 [Paraburkholderia madseniana]|uniref:hypothetical protein n=1 Tax=Paraburkholderia TaxID=1822464 RepID=UPI0015C571AF|nr:hypothetical protein [Paraburkholderia madseniana]NPT68067.1 hypothetical protein [Paraburkholderia madseniana]